MSQVIAQFGVYLLIYGTGDWTQGLMHAGQALYLLRHTPRPFSHILFPGLLANWKSFCLHLQSSWDYKHEHHTWFMAPISSALQ
jgi:hypothetical protein